MIDPYVGILILAFVIAGFLITMLVLASILGPRNASPTKQLPFECGSVSVGSVQDQRFNVRFYLVAMLFILFDIEVIFLYPWAMVLEEAGWYGYLHVLAFILILTVGLIYAWKKKVLDWNE